MKLAKIFYFSLCFTVMCVFFYFFCNSDKNYRDDSKLGKDPGFWLQKLVAYSEDTITEVTKCKSVPKMEDAFLANELWQPVPDSGIFLYSAFIDHRKQNERQTTLTIRILAMSKGVNTQPLYCQIWKDAETAAISKVQQEEIWVASWDLANASQYYRPYLFSCPAKTSGHLPIAVSLVREPCQNPQNLLRLKGSLPEAEEMKKDFVVCLKAMDFDRDLSLRLLEWAELQFLLGADKISAYIYRVHPNIMKVLRYYEDSGKFTIKQHGLPGDEPNDPEERSQFFRSSVWQKRRHEIIPYNDCLYEHMNTHRFVVNLDLDEAIVPMMNYNWSEMLGSIFEDHKMALTMYSSLSATNVYFFDSFGEYADDEDIPKYMHMLRHVYRSANFSSPGFAVKSFHATNNTLAVFNHYTLIPLYPDIRRNALIGRHLAQMHHYRATCPPLMDKECRTNYMKFYKKDTVLWKYKKPLVSNVRFAAKSLGFVA